MTRTARAERIQTYEQLRDRQLLRELVRLRERQVRPPRGLAVPGLRPPGVPVAAWLDGAEGSTEP